MDRNINLEDISDGKLYGSNDMVKADCNDCKGCFACCQGMGNSIVLDPLDIYRMTTGLHVTFESLLVDKLELNVVEGIILPNLKMAGAQETCAFLNDEGRCSIHSKRPGICRIFPLGRLYENGGFHYFLQVHECKKQNRTKVKVKKWIDTPDITRNEQFINRWHYFLKGISGQLPGCSDDTVKAINMQVLQMFFMTPYPENTDFYEEFESRVSVAEQWISEMLTRSK